MMQISLAEDSKKWDEFLKQQHFSPFLQSWSMGEVFQKIGQEPIRLVAEENGSIKGICLGISVPARRGKHLAIQYGPVTEDEMVVTKLTEKMKEIAIEHGCSFVRVSPFAPLSSPMKFEKAIPSPMHLLAEHLWYVPLRTENPWKGGAKGSGTERRDEELLMDLRKTTRNLVRRAEKEGVEIELSKDPVKDVELFITLHDETRKRHHFTPYTNTFFRAQVAEFAKDGNVLLYLARHQGDILAASIHMQFGGETSYHHGASVQSKIPASYLLQWRAMQDAKSRGDSIYNFWGIAPMNGDEIADRKHPFAGVTLFKRGFGGELLDLQHCNDIPLKGSYRMTRVFETLRKWKRGF